MKFSAILILIISLLTLGLAGYKTYQVFTHPIKFKNQITTQAKIYNLDASVVASLINVESSYNANDKSNKNAIGLMQIKLETANYLDELNKRNLVTKNELFNIAIKIVSVISPIISSKKIRKSPFSLEGFILLFVVLSIKLPLLSNSIVQICV